MAIYGDKIGKINASVLIDTSKRTNAIDFVFMKVSTSAERTKFAEDVLRGLTSIPKQLSSRYFYDDEGSRLFMEIMGLPEYYLTRAELKIFTEQTNAIYNAFTNGSDSLDLIELGAGDGTKTAVLIDNFLKKGLDLTYSPIDISQEANDALQTRFRDKFPNLRIKPHTGDYFRVLGSLRNGSDRRKLLMFLGSNIGNFSQEKALDSFAAYAA
jgi:uncharacterized SAM-dependent methyltransferase